jgi:hypothetical protein
LEHSVAGESVTKETEKLRAMLSAWRRPLAQLQDNAMCVASVASPRSGFVAVVSIDGEPGLVVSLYGQLSTSLESQISACELGNGADVQASCVDYDRAMHQLREWADRESASALAGLADSSVLRRRRLVNRIDTAIENAPPHSRTNRLTIAAKARRVAAAQHSAAIEAELESLAHASLSDEEWLAAVACVGSGQTRSGDRRTIRPGLQVHALLLLRGKSSPRVPTLGKETV